jgi:hypothetical protein
MSSLHEMRLKLANIDVHAGESPPISLIRRVDRGEHDGIMIEDRPGDRNTAASTAACVSTNTAEGPAACASRQVGNGRFV